MSKHKPVEVKAIQWAKVFKHIEEAGPPGIAVRDLAEALELDPPHPCPPALEKSLNYLQRQGRIRRSMGVDSKGHVNQVVQVDQGRETVRDRLNEADEEQPSAD